MLGWWSASKLARREALWAPRKPPVTPVQLDDLVLWITLGKAGRYLIVGWAALLATRG